MAGALAGKRGAGRRRRRCHCHFHAQRSKDDSGIDIGRDSVTPVETAAAPPGEKKPRFVGEPIMPGEMRVAR